MLISSNTASKLDICYLAAKQFVLFSLDLYGVLLQNQPNTYFFLKEGRSTGETKLDTKKSIKHIHGADKRLFQKWFQLYTQIQYSYTSYNFFLNLTI